MEQYRDLVQTALNGEETDEDRTGAGTTLHNNITKHWDLSDRKPPLVTSKYVPYRWVAEELFWFLDGETNIKPLLEKDVTIWSSDALRHNMDYVLDKGVFNKETINKAVNQANKAKTVLTNQSITLDQRKTKANKLMHDANQILDEYNQRILEDEEFAQEAGDLGPIYGAQWRGTNGATNPDQVSRLESKLEEGGLSRRMVVSAWNSSDLEDMALAPCHYSWQVNIRPESGKLDLNWNQRSCDNILGVPFNIASYGLLTHLLAKTHDFEPGKLTGNFANSHVYKPHKPAAEELLDRKPKGQPVVEIKNERGSVTDYGWGDVELIGYHHHGMLQNPTPMYGGLF